MSCSHVPSLLGCPTFICSLRQSAFAFYNKTGCYKHPPLSKLCLLPSHSHEGVCMLRRALCDGHHLAPSTQPASSSVPKNVTVQNSILSSVFKVGAQLPVPSAQPQNLYQMQSGVMLAPSNSSSWLVIFRLLLNSILAVL